MTTRNDQSSRFSRQPRWLVRAVLLVATFGLVCSSASKDGSAARTIDMERIVAWEALPEQNGDLCEMPADPSGAVTPVGQQTAQSPVTGPTAPRTPGAAHNGETAASYGWVHRSEVVAERAPLRVVADSYLSFAGITVDPARNEVVVGDQKMSKIVVYDRLENTPSTSAMSTPKRVIGGPLSFLEYVSSVYVDPTSGDIFAINNDTMRGMPVFGPNAVGNVAPKRRIERPHTAFAVAGDEETQELFLTIQDDMAVVVFKKNAADNASPVRILQGSRTRMADPHGIAVDPRRGEIFVSNWGQSNERPPLAEGGGGGNVNRPDFPVGRTRVFRGTGKIAPASITVFAKNAQGDAAPVRAIQGPRTQLNWPTALAVHPGRGELFVANDVGHSVAVFRTDANGDVAPIRVLGGPRSQIKHPTGVAVDVVNDELWVANFGDHSATVYRLDAAGDAAPLRVIRSAPVGTGTPMLSNAHVAVFDSNRKEILVAN